MMFTRCTTQICIVLFSHSAKNQLSTFDWYSLCSCELIAVQFLLIEMCEDGLINDRNTSVCEVLVKGITNLHTIHCAADLIDTNSVFGVVLQGPLSIDYCAARAGWADSNILAM